MSAQNRIELFFTRLLKIQSLPAKMDSLRISVWAILNLYKVVKDPKPARMDFYYKFYLGHIRSSQMGLLKIHSPLAQMDSLVFL